MPNSPVKPSKGASSAQTAVEALFTQKEGDPLRRAIWLDALDQRLRSHLSKELAAHVRLANINNDTLVFLADSPIWNTKLRLASQDLLDLARSLGFKLSNVQIRTAALPPQPLDNPRNTKPRPQSPIEEAAIADALKLLRGADPDTEQR